MDDLATLISCTYAPNAIGVQVPTETQTEIWVHVRSVTRAEWAAAGRQGLSPSFVLETNAANYSGQQTVIFRGVRYGIYRTFFPDGSDTVELYLERKVGVTNG